MVFNRFEVMMLLINVLLVLDIGIFEGMLFKLEKKLVYVWCSLVSLVVEEESVY